MFHAWAVNTVKMEAHSTPSSLRGNRPMKKVTVKVRKPNTGIDWRMSSAGTITSPALRLLAAAVATTKVNSSEAPMAANMRIVVRSAYSGSRMGSRLTGLVSRAETGRLICWAPCTTSTAAPPISARAIRS